MTRDGRGFLDWQATLRERRHALGLSQRELSVRSGLSLGAVKAYETGARTPSRASLTALVDALQLPREDANRVYAGAGYAIDWYTLLEGRYVFDLHVAAEQLEGVDWPAFITNQACDIVVANKTFHRLMNVIDERDRAALNLFSAGALEQFARRIDNYDELIMFMMGLAKGDPRRPQDLQRPAPWLQQAAESVMAGDPELAQRYMRLWSEAQPVPHRTTHQFRVNWRYEASQALRFVGMLTVADIWSELSRNDWIPADAQTWHGLEALRRAHADSG